MSGESQQADTRRELQERKERALYLASQGIPPTDETILRKGSDNLRYYTGSAILTDGSKKEIDMVGNWLSFGPAGRFSEIESALLVLLSKRLAQNPEGLRTLRAIIVKYLDTVGRVLVSMQHASATNWLTALMNQYTSLNIYARLGLISPRDQFTTKVWLDHVFGEMLKLAYVHDTLGSLTTLVTSTNESKQTSPKGYESERSTGLATLAKVLSEGAK